MRAGAAAEDPGLIEDPSQSLLLRFLGSHGFSPFFFFFFWLCFVARGILVPNQELNPHPLQCKCGVLTPGPPEKPHSL